MEDDLYLEKDMTIYQDIEKILTCTIYIKESSTAKLFLVSFLNKEIKHIDISNVLFY